MTPSSIAVPDGVVCGDLEELSEGQLAPAILLSHAGWHVQNPTH